LKKQEFEEKLKKFHDDKKPKSERPEKLEKIEKQEKPDKTYYFAK